MSGTYALAPRMAVCPLDLNKRKPRHDRSFRRHCSGTMRRGCSYSELFSAGVRRNNRSACRVGRWAHLVYRPPALDAPDAPLPRLRALLVRGFFCALRRCAPPFLFAYAAWATVLRDPRQPRKPSPAKPASIIAQVEGSGTGVPTSTVKVSASVPEPKLYRQKPSSAMAVRIITGGLRVFPGPTVGQRAGRMKCYALFSRC
jgi:hypothetical protein